MVRMRRMKRMTWMTMRRTRTKTPTRKHGAAATPRPPPFRVEESRRARHASRR